MQIRLLALQFKSLTPLCISKVSSKLLDKIIMTKVFDMGHKEQLNIIKVDVSSYRMY